ncbi:hypothetical protein SLS62_000340 [Diatrype stigma]|uniref:Peptide hydrolase n=1 Tax=Diatrype stigma TaxID=117547 RepID=A0AAN9V2N2_9PEZI
MVMAAIHYSPTTTRWRWKCRRHQHGQLSTTVLILCVLLLVLAVAPRGCLAYEELSDAALRSIPGGGFSDFDAATGALLAPLLIPRVPGTAGSAAAQRHIAGFFARELPAWTLLWHNSTSKTPATGDVDVPFASMIFRRDPPWTTAKGGSGSGDVARLTLAAHYDSLHQPAGFIGATDSAAPCAMLMHVARTIDEALTRKWDDLEASGMAGLDEERGVQILFLDGEEAWATWSATDSLYGARALAEAWEAEAHPARSAYRNPLDAIELFVLLDLLGAADPSVPSYFGATHWAYQGLARVEARLRAAGQLASAPSLGPQGQERRWLGDADKLPSQLAGRGYIQDDHVPFMARGVPVLHVIPSPFPAVWHRMEDDGAHLDPAAVADWAKIVAAFVAEWMELDGFIEHTAVAVAKRRGEDGDAASAGTRGRDKSEL